MLRVPLKASIFFITYDFIVPFSDLLFNDC